MNVEFTRLTEGFKEWLELINYEPSTVRYAPVKVHEFFSWLECQGIGEPGAITKPVINRYFSYLKTRENKRRKGARLSRNSLRTHRTALKNLGCYLRATNRESFEADYKFLSVSQPSINHFSREEIKALYASCADTTLGLRDRAMLAIYYGCGLRRNEGLQLDVADIHVNSNLVHVRSGKGHRERYVPMSAGVRADLQGYLSYSRPKLLKEETEQALFIGRRGMRQKRSNISARFQTLKSQSGVNTEGGLHTLRHTIATHLLQEGMELKLIKRFLGHQSLESTQIYTHL